MSERHIDHNNDIKSKPTQTDAEIARWRDERRARYALNIDL